MDTQRRHSKRRPAIVDEETDANGNKRILLLEPPESDSIDKKVYPPKFDDDFDFLDHVPEDESVKDFKRNANKKRNALILLGFVLYLYRNDRSQLSLLEGTSFTLPLKHYCASSLKTRHIRLKHLPAGYQFATPRTGDYLRVVTKAPDSAKEVFYRSVGKFIPHLLWLEASSKSGKPFNHQSCECCICRAIYQPAMKITHPVNLGNKRKKVDNEGGTRTGSGTVRKISLVIKEEEAEKHRSEPISAEEEDRSTEAKEKEKNEKDQLKATVLIKLPVKQEKEAERTSPNEARANTVKLIPAKRVYIERPSIVDYLTKNTLHISLPNILPPDNSLLYASKDNAPKKER